MGNAFRQRSEEVLLFLDVDGVLNSQESRRRNGEALEKAGKPLTGFDAPDAAMCDHLSELVKQTGAKVVLSSTWRLNPQKFAEIRRCLATRGVQITGATENFEGRARDNSRPDEIAAYVMAHSPVAAWVAIDDLPLSRLDRDFRETCAGVRLTDAHFVQTLDSVGLTAELAQQAIDKLAAQSTP